MTNKMLFLSAFLFTAATKHDNSYFSIESDITCLEQSYSGAKNSNINDINKFLNCFPTDYRKYSAIFGYGGGAYPNNSLMSNNEKIYSFLDLYFKLKTKQQDYKSLFLIAINGHWEVDAIGYYKHKLVSFIKTNPKIAAEELNRLNEKDLYSFWFFYFDGPHLEKDLPNEIIALSDYSESLTITAKYVFSYFQHTHIDN